MIAPKLYSENEREFVSLGFGFLADAKNIRVTSVINAPPQLDMDYPVTGWRFGELLNRRIIYSTTGPDGKPQPFRIYRITKPLGGVCKVYARHIAHDLMGYSVRPFTAANPQAAAQMLTAGAVVEKHEFTITAEISSSVAMTVATPRSIWSLLGGQRGSMLDVYGKGEWEFDHFGAVLKSRIGADNGARVRYGVNLRTCEQDENLANCWTAVQPYWYNQADDTLVVLPEETISTGSFDYTRILALDLTAEFGTAPTVEQLRSRAKQYISSNRVGVPAVGLDVDFVPLEQTAEYQDMPFLKSIRLGDSVTVDFPTAYDPETGRPTAMVQATARAVETVWLPLVGRYEKIRLGEKRANFVKEVALQKKERAWGMAKVR